MNIDQKTLADHYIELESEDGQLTYQNEVTLTYPDAYKAETGIDGLVVPAWHLLELVAKDVETSDPAQAAEYRRIATTYYPEMEEGFIDEDEKSNITS